MSRSILRLTQIGLYHAARFQTQMRPEQAGDKKWRRASIKNCLAAPCTILLPFGGEAYGVCVRGSDEEGAEGFEGSWYVRI